MATLSHTIFKPDDVVRTPTGRLATIQRINPDGSRLIEDSASGERYDIMPGHLTLVHAATPRPWPKRVL